GISGVMFTLFAGSVLGTGVGIAQMIRHRQPDRQMQIPFGPYLSAGALIYVYYGDKLIHWYFFRAVS
ncbi:MAG: prepilin peptidase, partial [Desulfotignum sp.]